MIGTPLPIKHAVKFFEKDDRPLEIIATRQWYLRNGGRDSTLREDLLEPRDQLRWSPGFMRSRCANWVGGLNGDWLISRQRVFGVPIPFEHPRQTFVFIENRHVPRDRKSTRLNSSHI